MKIKSHQIDRFWSRVDKKEEKNQCWLWKGYIDHAGYGNFSLNNKTYRSHRLSYILTYGDIPDGLSCCHACDNPACVNPNHLFVGTHKDNMNDMKNKGRQSKGEKHSLLHIGEKNSQHKLKEWQVREIKIALKNPYWGINNDLARKYGVKYGVISNIKNNDRWAHIIV